MGRNEERHTSMRDRIRQRAEANKSSGGSSYLSLPEGVTFYKLTKSTRNNPTILDIVPYEVTKDGKYHDGKFGEIELFKGDRWAYRTLLVHRNIGPDNKWVLCPRTKKEKCPICEYRAVLKKEDPTENKQLIQDLGAQVKTIMNLHTKDGIEILEHSYANFYEKLEKEMREGKEEWYDFAELEGGYTLEVVFSEETYMGNKYLEAGRIDFVERKDIPESILDKVVDLDACQIFLTYEELDALAFGDGIDTRKGGEELERESRGERTRERERDSNPEGRPGRGDREESSRERTREREPEKKETTRERTREPEKKEETKSSRRTAPPEDEKKSSGECPDGGEYGKDCNERKFCMECDKWEACADEGDRLKAKK